MKAITELAGALAQLAQFADGRTPEARAEHEARAEDALRRAISEMGGSIGGGGAHQIH
ncbi:hypothetical protein GCM10009737_08520 [Nocardioides lentus]|uniref:Uncharacterized protein n=1 Tax=Nocardioides lentus TaxID=338077 RepID=A0ABP5ABM8_9ACTN